MTTLDSGAAPGSGAATAVRCYPPDCLPRVASKYAGSHAASGSDSGLWPAALALFVDSASQAKVTPTMASLAVGMRVRARFMASSKGPTIAKDWFHGTVQKIHSDGSCDIDCECHPFVSLPPLMRSRARSCR